MIDTWYILYHESTGRRCLLSKTYVSLLTSFSRLLDSLLVSLLDLPRGEHGDCVW